MRCAPRPGRPWRESWLAGRWYNPLSVPARKVSLLKASPLKVPWNDNPTVLRLLALLALSDFVRTGFLVPYLTLTGKGLFVSTAAVGLIVGANYLADGLAKGPIGVLTERVGLGRMAVLGALAGSLAVFALPRLPVFFVAALLSFAWGLTLSALWPGVMTAISHFAKPDRQSRALSWASVAAAPGVALGALGMGFVMQRVPELGYPLLLGAQLLALLLALSLAGLKLPGGETRAMGFRWRRVAVLIPAAFAQTLAPGLLVAIFYPYLRLLGLSVASLLLPALLAALVGLIALPLAGRLADRLHPRLALLPGLLLLAVAFALLGSPGVSGKLWVVAPVAGLAYALFLTGWNGLVARTLPQERRAAAWGAIMAVEALGYAVGPTLGGLMWDRFGPPGPFWLGAAMLALVQLYYLLPWRARARAGGGLGAESGAPNSEA